MSLDKWFKEKWVDISTKKDGKHPKCGRSKGDGRGYPKCVPQRKAMMMSAKEKKQATNRKRATNPSGGGKTPTYARTQKMAKTPAWQRKEGKSPSGGLNARGRASLRRQGKNIKRPVSRKQAKKSPKAAARRRSFCKRMMGMKKKLTSKKVANDPNSRINKSLRKWDC